MTLNVMEEYTNFSELFFHYIWIISAKSQKTIEDISFKASHI